MEGRALVFGWSFANKVTVTQHTSSLCRVRRKRIIKNLNGMWLCTKHQLCCDACKTCPAITGSCLAVYAVGFYLDAEGAKQLCKSPGARADDATLAGTRVPALRCELSHAMTLQQPT